MSNTKMHKKQKLSSVVSLSNSYGTMKTKHGFVNVCNENTMKCSHVINPGEIFIFSLYKIKFVLFEKINLLNLNNIVTKRALDYFYQILLTNNYYFH